MTNPIAHSWCPYCGMKINLSALKDSDSLSKKEVLEHVKAHHPEKNTAHGIPFSPIFFYDLSALTPAPPRKHPPEDTDEARVRRRQAARAALTDSPDGGST